MQLMELERRKARAARRNLAHELQMPRRTCDVYFYTVGQRMGIDTIADYAKQFGLGKETGIELPSERVGIVPRIVFHERNRLARLA